MASPSRSCSRRAQGDSLGVSLTLALWARTLALPARPVSSPLLGGRIEPSGCPGAQATLGVAAEDEDSAVSRIVAGVIGWLAGTLPLIIVNIASFENLLNQRNVLIWGVVALLAGIALGAGTAGYFGARSPSGARESESAGLTGAGMAGGLAAVLFVATLMGMMIGSARLEIAPALIAVHPIRVTMAIVCLAALLVSGALAVGALVSRYAPAPEAASYAPRSQPARGYAGRPYANPAPPSTPVSPRLAGNSRPDPRQRPPSGPTPRSVPMPPPERRNPPRR